MACDTDDKNTSYDCAFAITTNPFMNFSCARTLYSFEKYDSGNTDEVVHYGEKICIVAHSEVYTKKVVYNWILNFLILLIVLSFIYLYI